MSRTKGAPPPTLPRHSRNDIRMALEALHGRGFAYTYAHAMRIIEDCIQDMHTLSDQVEEYRRAQHVRDVRSTRGDA